MSSSSLSELVGLITFSTVSCSMQASAMRQGLSLGSSRLPMEKAEFMSDGVFARLRSSRLSNNDTVTHFATLPNFEAKSSRLSFSRSHTGLGGQPHLTQALPFPLNRTCTL